MGINIGLDIGSISLKLAALGAPEDRSALQRVCASNSSFRLIEWAGVPLVLLYVVYTVVQYAIS